MDREKTKDETVRFRCEAELKRDLEAFAKQRGIPVAQVIRDAVGAKIRRAARR